VRWTLSVDTTSHPIGDVMSRISALGNVLDVTINNPPMEEIIAAIFASRGGAVNQPHDITPVPAGTEVP